MSTEAWEDVSAWFIVTVSPVADVLIAFPPAMANVSLFKSIAIVPLSDVTSKSSAVICAST